MADSVQFGLIHLIGRKSVHFVKARLGSLCCASHDRSTAAQNEMPRLLQLSPSSMSLYWLEVTNWYRNGCRITVRFGCRITVRFGCLLTVRSDCRLTVKFGSGYRTWLSRGTDDKFKADSDHELNRLNLFELWIMNDHCGRISWPEHGRSFTNDKIIFVQHLTATWQLNFLSF